ncbi:MAG TPA: hypothetical protein VJ866_08220 [Pyrinomonadaceae bacterium]|nr:hypothetical protein [Pyrinomonadaceae bacterium]
MNRKRKLNDEERNLNDEGEARSSRRRFTKTLAAAVVAAPAAAAIARAQTPPKTAEPKAPPNPQPTPTPAPQGPPKPSPLAEAYTEAARMRFGEHLSAEQLEAVKRDLEGNVRTAERLRSFKLQNSDEPDFVFSA